MKKQKRRVTKHHIVPRSRVGGKTKTNNIAYVREDSHNKYHHLFGNRTPEEIIAYLVEYYWAGQWKWVIKSFIEKGVKNGYSKVHKK